MILISGNDTPIDRDPPAGISSPAGTPDAFVLSPKIPMGLSVRTRNADSASCQVAAYRITAESLFPSAISRRYDGFTVPQALVEESLP